VTRLFPFLLLAGTVLVSAREEAGEAPPARRIPAISLLPDGSELEAVMLPRYDANRRLLDVLRAGSITLVDRERISGKEISLELYQPDGGRRARIELGQAVLDQGAGRLTADQEVRIQFERLFASGSALVYDFEQGVGFLSGPATTRISQPIQTAMNFSPTPLTAGAMLGVSLISLAIAETTPPKMSPEEVARLEADAAPRGAAMAEAAAGDARELEQVVAASDGARHAAVGFLREQGLMHIANQAEETARAAGVGEPLVMVPDPLSTVIQAEDGIYFDAEEGLLVYLKNVKVSDPRMELTGADELKVFFDKKPEEPKKKPEQAVEDPEGEPEGEADGGLDLGRIGGGLGDVSRVVATGAVRILQKGVEGKEPIEASGAILTYDMKSGEIIISGGYPWVKQGPNFFRATRPNERLRVFSNGSFRTEGFWEMGGRLNQTR
jgi:lipopolysaccharide export system protein LptA